MLLLFINYIVNEVIRRESVLSEPLEATRSFFVSEYAFLIG